MLHIRLVFLLVASLSMMTIKGVGQTIAEIDSMLLLIETDIPDSTRYELYNIVVFGLSRVDSEKALALSNDHMQYAISKEDYREEIIAHYNHGVIYRNMGKYNLALPHMQEYLEFRTSIKDTIGMGHGTYQLGLIYKSMGDYDKALELYNDCISYKKQIQDLPGLAITINSKGGIFKNMGKYDLAIKEHRTALALNKSLNRLSGISSCYANIGAAFADMGAPDTALVYFRKQLDIAEQRNSRYDIASANENIGNLLVETGNPSEAITHFDKALTIREDMGHLRYIMINNRGLAEATLSTKRFKEALEHAQKSLTIAKEQGMNDEIRHCHNTLYKIYKAQGNYKTALAHHENYTSASDSVWNSEVAEAISSAEAKFKTKEKEYEIEVLEQEKEKQKIQLSYQRMGLFGLVVGLSLLSGLLFQIRKKNLKIEGQNSIISAALKEKDFLLKEIHHRVKNNLQVISSLLKLQSKSIQDTNAQQALDEGRNRVRSMALIHQNLYQDDNVSSINARLYLTQLIDEVMDSYQSDDKRIETTIDIDDIFLDVDVLAPIGLITNELLTNSLKYAFKGKDQGTIFLSFKGQDNGGVVYTVSDDGIGFDQENVRKKSFGFRLIRAFADRITATYKISSEDGTSTTFIIPAQSGIAVPPET